MLSKKLCQIRLPSALCHKAEFAYEYPGREALVWWAGDAMGPVVGRATR
jgi:hypothetical protein